MKRKYHIKKKTLFVLSLLTISTFCYSQREVEYKVSQFSPTLVGDNQLYIDSTQLGHYIVEKIESSLMLGEVIKGDGSLLGMPITIIHQIKTNGIGAKKILGIRISLMTGGDVFYFENKLPNRIQVTDNILWCFKNNGDAAKFKIIEKYGTPIYKPLEVISGWGSGTVNTKFDY